MYETYSDDLLHALMRYNTVVAEDLNSTPDEVREAHICMVEIQSERRYRREERNTYQRRERILNLFGFTQGGGGVKSSEQLQLHI